jgi:hypothetical protein
MYTPFLSVHSWLRWLTLLLAIGATINALRGDSDLSAKPPGRHWDTFFMMALDVQVFFGLVLYFGLSPVTRFGLENMGEALVDPQVRFWTFTHVLGMTTANVLVRIGRVKAINAKTSADRRKWRFRYFALTSLAILAFIPWPGLANGRPLFRL